MIPTSFSFDVLGQKGEIPAVGFGTATLFNDKCTEAVRCAIKAGVRHIDTALLYNNQAAVGTAIAAAIRDGDVKREDLFITTKVAFFPPGHNGNNAFAPICFNANNIKGQEEAGIAECLALLKLDYVDLLLIHNPLTDLTAYSASAAPHAFELGRSILDNEERDLILSRRLERTHACFDFEAAEATRAASWRALEEAQAQGQARYIGVSNYPAALIKSMRAYARVMPCCNQLEFHPRFSSPALCAEAAQSGMVLTAYGSGNSVAIEKSPIVAAIASRKSVSPVSVVLTWTLQHGVAVIPRTANPDKIASNARAAQAEPLSSDDLSALDELNAAHPYYWEPMPCLPRGAEKDLGRSVYRIGGTY
jgi:diketogulonate reductase-like aldo/keto reductase